MGSATLCSCANQQHEVVEASDQFALFWVQERLRKDCDCGSGAENVGFKGSGGRETS
jgi:hypothetical protein